MMKNYLVVLSMFLGALVSQGARADVQTVDTSGGSYDYSWSSGLGFANTSFSLTAASPSKVSVSLTDCCVPGDEFALWLDGVKQSWSSSGYSGSYYTGTLSDLVLGAGSHTFTIELTALAPGYTSGGATATFSALAPVPEPETYAMLLAGLGLMGAVARRRKQ